MPIDCIREKNNFFLKCVLLPLEENPERKWDNYLQLKAVLCTVTWNWREILLNDFVSYGSRRIYFCENKVQIEISHEISFICLE